ncbi:protein kinase domain-containing protein [Psychrobacter sp. CAL346-MNA-CIBAN-0220]|uniref:protein kinase domain-containing protein n=1 Tax=Psychrobacter sp. CAL346-MNA-CIBAN-0220 TaxID=3140457 RepID=UPI0033180501
MKNSASNPFITQALRAQAVQLLPLLTTSLSKLGYHQLSHQRISQQDSHQQYHIKTTTYQGLTRAQHTQFGDVMIKWELMPRNTDANHRSSDLSHEIAVLQILNKSAPTEAQNNSTTSLCIAPPILAYDASQINILNQNYQLTILVMPHCLHGSLAHYLHQHLSQQDINTKKDKLLTDEQKYQLIVQSAYLIACLHNSGWLHNDIKPSNILIKETLLHSTDNENFTPTLLLTDFSLATCFYEASDGSAHKDFNQESTINAAGTAVYLAPERWQGQDVTQQSDIYAFGIMMYEILTGIRPFKIAWQRSEPLKYWAIEHCQTPIPALPKEYQNYQPVINKVLAKRIERRYKSMEEVLGDLENS